MRGEYIMLYIFMGQSCTGKSTAADKVKELNGAEVFAGKDYMRMAKNENEAWILFHDKLSKAASMVSSSEETMIYLVTERSQLDRIIDIEGACKVKFMAPLDTIKSRFAQRMHGKLPDPVEKMLGNQYEEWKTIEGDIHVDTTVEHDMEKILSLIGCPGSVD
jgi:predicted kinase